MSGRWEVSPEFPGGHMVPLTADEVAQRSKDDAEGAQRALTHAEREAHDIAIRVRLESALDLLENTQAWSLRTQAERVEALRRANAALIRLALSRLEATG